VKADIEPSSLSKRAFPCHNDPRKIFSNLLKNQRGLKIRDFYAFCKVLHLHPDRVFIRAVVELEQSQ
jgi:hypothetical protein